MGKLLEAIKAIVPEGTDLKDVETLIEASTIEGIDSKEKAYDFIVKNSNFKSALDYATGESVKNHDKKFMDEKFPELLKGEREKIMKELKPEETPEQKELRELREKMNALEQEKETIGKRDQLRAKAKELGYPEEIAERYTAFGDKAMEVLESDSTYWKTKFETDMEARTKELYKGNPPPRQSSSDPKKEITRSSYESLSPTDQSKFVADGGSVVDG